MLVRNYDVSPPKELFNVNSCHLNILLSPRLDCQNFEYFKILERISDHRTTLCTLILSHNGTIFGNGFTFPSCALTSTLNPLFRELTAGEDLSERDIISSLFCDLFLAFDISNPSNF
jgi:hypothetical protein